MKNLILLLFTVTFVLPSFAQHSDEHTETESFTGHSEVIHQGVTLLYGSILLPKNNQSGQEVGMALLPSLSLDYEIWWRHKIGLIVMNEFVLNSYEVKANSGEYFTRESILISALGIGYSPIKHLAVYVGAGSEMDLSNGTNFFICRIGSEYAIPIRNNWASILALAGDFRNQYKSVSFEIGFAKTW